jgi:hypothetical protein
VLKLLPEMIKSKHKGYKECAIEAFKEMFKKLKDEIIDIKTIPISKMVDIAREERLEKVDRFIGEF